jgi:hypothetical protein
MAYFNDDDQFSFDSVPGGGPRRLQGDMPTFSFDAAGQGQAPPEAPETPSFDTPHAPTPSSFGGGQTSLYQPSGASAPATSMAPPSNRAQPTNGNPGMIPNYQSTLDQLKTTSDPRQQAVLKDQLARNVFSSLKDAGHDVKWQGDQLMVDGRAYVVGGGIAQGEGQPNQGPAPKLDPTTDRPSYGGMPAAGYDAAKWNDPNSDSAKYIVSRTLAGIQDQIRAIPDEAGRKAFVQQHLQDLVPQLEAAGWHVLDVRGEKLRIEGHGAPAHWADAIGDIEGAATIGWSTDLPQGQEGPSMSLDGILPEIYQAGGPNTSYAPTAPAQPSWAPGNHAHYTPGEITTDDIPNYSFDELFNRVVGDGDVSRPLLDSILAQPGIARRAHRRLDEGEDARTNSRSSSSSRRRTFGAWATRWAIDDSPWLASERLSSRRGRDHGRS